MKQLNNETINSHFESLYPPTVRYKEIEQILSYIKGGNSAQILGIPGVGRSNLLGMLAYNHNVRVKHLGENQKWFHFVVANFSEIQKRPLIDAAKFLFLSLIDSLRERGKEEEYHAANDIFKESLSFNDKLVLFAGLKRVVDLLALEKELTIVFLFDRFETYIPMLTPQFFANLRTLRSRAKYRFSVVFSLERPLEDMLEGSLFADFYEFVAGHLVYLNLTDKEGIDFRISYLEKATGKKLGEKEKFELLKLTGGHGKLTKVCVEAVLSESTSEESLRNTSEVTAAELTSHGGSSRSLPAKQGDSLDEMENFLLSQKTVTGVLWEFWYFLTPSEQTALSNHGLTSHGGSSRCLLREGDSLNKPVTKGDSLSEARGVSLSKNSYLEKVGLTKNGILTIPLFEKFLTRCSIVPGNGTIVFDQNSNNILKGDQVLSDKLTSLEFKLLRFFIQNSNKILTREEVINAVWQDAKSTAGVTDQALDQLIFRLRKKVEDNPNNPNHLQTIKGRGFKFVP